jgi:hypothetical protein
VSADPLKKIAKFVLQRHQLIEPATSVRIRLKHFCASVSLTDFCKTFFAVLRGAATQRYAEDVNRSMRSDALTVRIKKFDRIEDPGFRMRTRQLVADVVRSSKAPAPNDDSKLPVTSVCDGGVENKQPCVVCTRGDRRPTGRHGDRIV